MSNAHLNPLPTGETSVSDDQKNAHSPSFAEQFLNSFFQEKNIKWMLMIGAAIVFGSSLMLVTRAWPNWGYQLRYLTVLGYTAATFAAAEFGRKQLGLVSTSRVLHSLTLLLLPVCFLALDWISAGTARQQGARQLEVIGLMIPATAFLWFAGTRIFDNLLRGRQTTFLVCYQLLCVAGALAPVTQPLPAAAFLLVCWAVFHVNDQGQSTHLLDHRRTSPASYIRFSSDRVAGAAVSDSVGHQDDVCESWSASRCDSCPLAQVVGPTN